MAAPLLNLSAVGKDYAKTDHNVARVRLVVDLLRGRGVAHAFRARLIVYTRDAINQDVARAIFFCVAAT